MAKPTRKGEGERKKRRSSRDDADELDLVKVARLRAALEAGHLGVDFDSLVERLVHAMRG